MKKVYLSLLFAGLISISSSFAQQIPFQGRLLEAGIPVDGTRNFDFSINVDGNVWTESHAGVPVNEGLYSVVLGSINPLPSDLFKGVESRALNISVGPSDMSPIQIFAPPTSYYFENSDPSDLRPALHAVMSGNTTGWATIEGESYADTGATGIYGNGSSAVDGESTGVYGYANGAGKSNTGVFGWGRGLGNGDNFESPGGGSYNNGVIGWAHANTFGNAGVFGRSYGTTGVDNLGVVGWSEVMNGGENKGVLGWAKGDGINKGIVGMATGGTENWAGWFEGDVKITGNLNSSGSHSFSKTIETGTGFDQGLLVEIDGDGKEINNAIRGNASTNALNTGVGGYSTSGALNTSNQYGLYGEANGDGTGSHNGVFGVAGSTGKYNRGLRGYAEGAGNGDTGPGFGEGSINFGVEGNATGNAYNNTGVEGSNFGPDGVWNFGVHGISSAGTGVGVENHGVRGAAYGPGINYGVFGDAGGGAENWAGYFNGDVNITGNLVVGGNAPASITKDITGLAENFGNKTELTGAVDVSNTEWWQAAYYGTSNTEGNNAGLFGWGASESTNANFITGVQGSADGSGTGPRYGVRGETFGTGTDYSVAVLAYNQTEAVAFGTSIGVYGRTFNGITDGTQMAVRATASGVGGTNYGVFSTAANGDENWAGWFAGDVKITGNLSLDQPLSLGTAAYSLGEKDWEPDNQGFLHLYGETTTGDALRVALEASGGIDNAVGTLSLYGPVYNDGGCPTCPRSFVNLGAFNDSGSPNDQTGWAGQIDMYGTNSPNVIIGAQGYQNHDLANISLFGNKPDGGGWFYSHANIGVNQDGTQQWGYMQLFANDGDMNFELGAKSGEDGTIGAQRPYLKMQGSINDSDLVWMEVFDDGNSNEAGGITFRSTDGSEFGINAYGFTGVVNDLNINNFSVVGDVNDNATQIDHQSLNILKGGAGAENDNGWNVVSLNGNDNGSRQWGSLTLFADNNDLNVEIGAKEWEGPAGAGAQRPYLKMQGSVNDADLVWMDVFDVDNDGLRESGGISFNSTDGFNYNMNAYGINGVNFNTSFDAEGDGLLNLSSTSPTGIRMYGALDDGGGRRSHIALDGNLGEYVYLWGNGSIDASVSMSVGTGGEIYMDGASGQINASTFNQTSDKRYKTNINTLKNSLSNVLQLRGVSYTWKDPNKSQKIQIGVIAQEVEEVYPEFVHTDAEGMKSVNYSQMVAVLIEAVKELNEKIESLESENTELRASLDQAEKNSEQIKSLQKQINTLVALMGSGQSSDIQVTGEEK